MFWCVHESALLGVVAASVAILSTVYVYRVSCDAPNDIPVLVRFLLSDRQGRFSGVVKAARRTLPTGLLAQEPRVPTPPPLHLPRIPHAGCAVGHPDELVAQIASEARGSLEALEISEFFSGIHAKESARDSHPD